MSSIGTGPYIELRTYKDSVTILCWEKGSERRDFVVTKWTSPSLRVIDNNINSDQNYIHVIDWKRLLMIRWQVVWHVGQRINFFCLRLMYMYSEMVMRSSDRSRSSKNSANNNKLDSTLAPRSSADIPPTVKCDRDDDRSAGQSVSKAGKRRQLALKDSLTKKYNAYISHPITMFFTTMDYWILYDTGLYEFRPCQWAQAMAEVRQI